MITPEELALGAVLLGLLIMPIVMFAPTSPPPSRRSIFLALVVIGLEVLLLAIVFVWMAVPALRLGRPISLGGDELGLFVLGLFVSVILGMGIAVFRKNRTPRSF